jgi:hypothetical protein
MSQRKDVAIIRPRPQISLLYTPRSEAVETPLREDIDKLDTFSEGILTRTTPRSPLSTSAKTGRGTASPSQGVTSS